MQHYSLNSQQKPELRGITGGDYLFTHLFGSKLRLINFVFGSTRSGKTLLPISSHRWCLMGQVSLMPNRWRNNQGA